MKRSKFKAQFIYDIANDRIGILKLNIFYNYWKYELRFKNSHQNLHKHPKNVFDKDGNTRFIKLGYVGRNKK